jgi:hypothetical protein
MDEYDIKAEIMFGKKPPRQLPSEEWEKDKGIRFLGIKGGKALYEHAGKTVHISHPVNEEDNHSIFYKFEDGREGSVEVTSDESVGRMVESALEKIFEKS